MKYTFLSTLLFALTIINTAFAGTKYSYLASDVDWEKNPKLTELAPEDTGFNAVYIVDENYYQIAFIDEFKGQKLSREIAVKFSTIHERVRLNNDDGVERFNTKYIALPDDRDLVNIKARSINPDGTVTKLNDKNIKFVENYEGYGPMKIFAFEGVQVGAEIEFIYTMVEPAGSLYGSSYVQYDFPIKKHVYSYTYPDHLIFETKSYNGAPDAILDTLDENYRFIIEQENVKAFEEEDYFAGDANKARIEYKLEENTYNGKSGFYSYQEAASEKTQYLYSFHPDAKLGKKEGKAFKKMMKSLNDLKNASEEKKIYAIEEYVKTNYNVTDEGGTFLLHKIYKDKIISEYGAIRLYVLLLDALDVEHRVVFTNNRFKKKFDPDFETYNYLDEGNTLIYFPGLDLYTSPSAQFYRIGLVPTGYSYTYGLHVKQKEIGGVKAAYPEVKYIEGLSSDEIFDNMYINVALSDNFDALMIDMKIEKQGYGAANVRPFLTMLNDEKRKELLESQINILEADAEVLEVEASNTEMGAKMIGKPFVVEGKLKAPALLEKAGPKYLVKIGDVIGPQVEMYQEKERVYEMETSYNHSYKRVITFDIPEGYKVVNLEDLKMDFFSEVDGERTMEFKVTYKLEGDQLIITCTEFYNEIRVPLERFEEFRSVINAAADFNKKVLVLEKK